MQTQPVPAASPYALASATLPAPPRVAGIPTQLTTFVGREREIEVILRLFRTTRLLTLSGAGGSGKTRLAVETMLRDSASAGRDGAWVELSPVRDPALVPDAVLEALGVREQSETQTPVERLTDFLRDRQFILVLDNCEHLVDACAALVDALLRQCPGLRVVATSREALGVAAETAWLVPPLSLPSADGDAAGESEAVQLFVDRARDARSSGDGVCVR